MSRYKLRANYDIENIDSQKMDGTVIVDVPMLSNGELNYGLSHVKKKLYEENVYPSEIGFDIMSLALIVKVVVSKNLYSCFDRLSDIVLYLT